MRSALLCASSAEGLFLFVVSKRLRAFRNYFFTGEVVTKNGSCRAAFCESTARRGEFLPSGSGMNPLRLTFVRQLPRKGELYLY